ncbi:hypothetical protein SteCoe_30913 [Stentor coeruleus]|uniref:Ion transport domain-containing protein n=1 Tax=Stentor coeruleus TaxID=5963 RepID=A0A1R2B2L5_9CILI|nr:hypothetical protein SteCoe_30913 [Stentor coeruleus]
MESDLRERFSKSNFQNEILTEHSFFTERYRSLELESISKALKAIESQRGFGFGEMTSRCTMFSGHQNSVSSVCISPNNTFLASSSDSTIILWDIISNEQIQTLTGHKNIINHLCFTKNSKYLLSSSDDCRVIIWNLNDFSISWIFKEPSVPVKAFSCSPLDDFFALNISSDIISIVNIETHDKECNLVGHTNDINCLIFSSDGGCLISGSNDKSVKIWDLSKKTEEITLLGHSGPVTALALVPKSCNIASGSADCSIKIWDFEEKQEAYTINIHALPIKSLCISPFGPWLLSSALDLTLKAWNLNDKIEEAEISPRDSIVNCIFYSESEDIFVTGDDNANVFLYNMKKNIEEYTFDTHEGMINCMCLSPDNQFLAYSANKILYLYSIKDKTIVAAFSDHKDIINSITFSSDSLWIVTGSSDTTIKIWDLNNKQLERTLRGHLNIVTSVCISPDGKWLISGSKDKNIKIWDFVKRFESSTLRGHYSGIKTLCFIMGSALVASAGYDCIIKVFNLEDSKLCWSLVGHKDFITSICPSDDGKWIASGSNDGIVKIWNLAGKREEIEFSKHLSMVTMVKFCKLCNYVVSSGLDGMIKIWNIIEKRLEASFEVDTGPVLCMNIKEDDITKSIVTGSEDGKIKFWSFLPSTPDINLHPSSIFESSYYSPISYFGTIKALADFNYSIIYPSSCNIFISNLLYTPLHLLSYKGKTNKIESLLKTKTIIFSSDSFGKSPLFYSTAKKHQKITDIMIEYLYNLSEDADRFLYISSFHAIRDDIIEIIQSSSENLHLFLYAALDNQYSDIAFGCVMQRTKFFDMSVVSFNDFIDFKETNEDEEPLKLKVSLFPLPAYRSSGEMVKVLRALLSCTNKEIFKTQIIQTYINYKWQEWKLWIYFHAFIMLINLIFLCLILTNFNSIFYLLSFIFVNWILVFIELVQLLQDGKKYFYDPWNLLDSTRIILTILWILSIVFSMNFLFFNWIVTAFNFISCITGFRVSVVTRYYVILIFKSLWSIQSFLIIFSYTTIAFGIMSIIATESYDINFRSAWVGPFGLAFGIDDMQSLGFDLKYLTYACALIFNVILMLNMIISVLSDAYDEYQLLSIYYDYRQMIEAILEITQIFSLFTKTSNKSYMHLCVNAYNDKDEAWQGKLLDIFNYVDKATGKLDDTFVTKIDDIERSIISKIKDNEKIFKQKNAVSEEKNSKNNRLIKEKISSVDDRLGNLETKMQGFEEKLEKIIDLVSKLGDR